MNKYVKEVKSTERMFDGAIKMGGTRNWRGDIVLEGYSEKAGFYINADVKLCQAIITKGIRDDGTLKDLHTIVLTDNSNGKFIGRRWVCFDGKRYLVGPYFLGLLGDEYTPDGIEEEWRGINNYYSLTTAIEMLNN